MWSAGIRAGPASPPTCAVLPTRAPRCDSGAATGRYRPRHRHRGATSPGPSRSCTRWVALTGRLVAHDSTADTARDLDYLRRLVGDRRLTHLGISYGTFIGQPYANMFPGR